MNGFLKTFMTKKSVMWLKLCLSLSKPVNEKRMLYNEISFYMLLLTNVCNEALWQSEHPSFDPSSTPADQ